MKEIEITTRVLENLTEIDKKLTNQGFKYTRTGFIDDIYMMHPGSGDFEIQENNISESLKKCVLIRYLDNGIKIFKGLTYKNKTFNSQGVTMSEEKINVDINDLDSAKKLLLAVGFKELVRVTYKLIVYEKDGLEFAFQDIDGLGILLEYEHTDNFDNVDDDTIFVEKQKMLSKIKSFDIKTSDEMDVKKAYELLQLKINTL